MLKFPLNHFHSLKHFSLFSLLFTGVVFDDIAMASNGAIERHETIQMLYDFEDDSVPSDLVLLKAKGTFLDNEVDASSALRIQMQSQQNKKSGIIIRPQMPWDWSQLENFSLAFDIANQGEFSTQIYLDIKDGDGAVYTRTVSIPVGGFHTYYAKMRGHDLGTPNGDENVELNFKSGLRGNPPTWDGYNDRMFISMWGKKNLKLSAIQEVTMSVQSALRDKEITIDSIRLIKNPELKKSFLTGMVDQYGQNATCEFEGKIHNDQELFAQRDAELKELNNRKKMTDRSQYSGWSKGPKLDTTGYFRTEKVNGKWSLVTPDGRLYFATGIDIIRLANSTTMTGYDFDPSLVKKRSADDLTPEDSMGLNSVIKSAIPSRHLVSEVRANMFKWLPSYDEPLGKHFGYRREAHSGPMKKGEVYSFYSANLERKYGEMGAYMDIWQDISVNRMLNWGFTSFGNWTDPSFYDNDRIPFFANGWIIGDFKTVSSGNDFWAPMPDVFDPVFEERAMATVRQVAAEVKGSPWCVGVFIDNEKSFGRPETNESRLGIVLHTLRRDGKDVPTKAAFTKLMKDKYEDISSLNKAWGKTISSWEKFDKGINSDIKTATQLNDYSDLLHTYADQYFSVVSKAVKKLMPNHLYLGSRFPDWGMPIEVVSAAAKHADVVSFNSYKEGLPKHTWAFLAELDKPCIIGEFHFGATDSGLYHPGLIHASSQKDRARMYMEYMHSVIDNPFFVGAHWFQYIDSPITGRAFDGENYNVGFVSVADVPYAPMVKAAKELHSDLYQRRFGEHPCGNQTQN